MSHLWRRKIPAGLSPESAPLIKSKSVAISASHCGLSTIRWPDTAVVGGLHDSGGGDRSWRQLASSAKQVLVCRSSKKLQRVAPALVEFVFSSKLSSTACRGMRRGKHATEPGRSNKFRRAVCRKKVAEEKRRKTRRDSVVQKSPAQNLQQAVAAERSAVPGVLFVIATGSGGAR